MIPDTDRYYDRALWEDEDVCPTFDDARAVELEDALRALIAALDSGADTTTALADARALLQDRP